MADTTFTDFGAALDAAAAEITAQSGENTTPIETSSVGGGEQGNTGNGGGSAQTGADPTNTQTGDTPNASTAQGAAKPDGENQQQRNQQQQGQGDLTRRQQNFLAAQRRFRQKRENARTRERIEQLNKERQELLNKNDEQSAVLAHQKESQMADLLAMEQDRAYNEWCDAAYDTFGEDAEKFIADSKRYSQYVMKHEPDVAAMTDKPYGQLLLRAWMNRMDNPTSRQQWLNCDTFEKQKILHSLYDQIAKMVNNGGAAQPPQQTTQPPQQTPQVNVPVPGSGRDTNNIPPNNDFGMQLQQAANELHVKW